jgi:hypothetical protein
VAGLRRKLDNPSFVARAPAEVVEKDRARVAELEQRTSKVQENLNRIEPEGTMSEKTPEEMFQSTPPTPSSGMFGIPNEPSHDMSPPVAATPAPRKAAPAKKKPARKKAKAKAKPKVSRKAKRAVRRVKRKVKRVAKKATRKAAPKRSGRRKVVRRTTKRRGRR